jgi:hypothetical protein
MKFEVDKKHALQIADFVDALANPTAKDGIESIDETLLYPQGCYLMAQEQCTCGDNHPTFLRATKTEIFVIGLQDNAICENKNTAKNKEKLDSFFQDIEIVSPMDIIEGLIHTVTLRSAQSRGLKDQLKDVQQELAEYKDAITSTFIENAKKVN